jgi:hypothetical protein
MSMDQLNTIMNKAKSISEECASLLEHDKINVKQMFRVMLKMNESMLEMMSKLRSAIESKTESIVCKFEDQLQSCTSFISKELNHVKEEIDEVKKDDKIECIDTVQTCSRDLKKVWIRFVYAKDAEDIRRANSHAAIEEIFSQLDIELDMTLYPIETFFFATKKFTQDQLIPEIALCCVFTSSAIASIVKNGIRSFNKALENQNKSQFIRYKFNTDWSYNIRKILKPCYEMKSFDVIERVLVTNDGIKVYHKDIEHKSQSDRKSTTTMVNSTKMLDILRKKLKDFNNTVPSTETYNKEYFSQSFEARRKLRNSYIENSCDESGYQVSDDDFPDVAIKST